MVQQNRLDKGKIEKLVLALRSIQAADAGVADKLRTEAAYLERNAERMRYPKFRYQRLFVGSGVIEAGCKTVIDARLKPSGMFWTVRGANAILALRCCQLNGRFEDYWEARRGCLTSISMLHTRCRAGGRGSPPGNKPRRGIFRSWKMVMAMSSPVWQPREARPGGRWSRGARLWWKIAL